MSMIQSYPILTIGIVVLNRDWIIERMLSSLIAQRYPHDRIFVIVADGGSKDKTVPIASKLLEESDFMGYEIISCKCNIPEGRNLCIEKMKGEMLFFWDSDVIMDPDAILGMVVASIKNGAHILTADGKFIYEDSLEKALSQINEMISGKETISVDTLEEVVATPMGYTLVSREVLNSVRFDPDLTSLEDYDFSARARQRGFKIFLDRSVKAFDVNVKGQFYSDIHTDMPIGSATRGLRKKAKANVLAFGPRITLKKGFRFFLTYKRYLFYIGYIPALIITIYGAFGNYLAALVFPVYCLLFLALQIVRRGIKRGIQSMIRSLVVGLPYSMLLIYYFMKFSIWNSTL